MAIKILVVDDDHDTLQILKLHLDASGYETMTAEDGEKALEQIVRSRPDLIIADLLMPNLNGWWLSRKIKEDERLKDIPLILLSGLLTGDGPPSENEVGDYYMSKPINFEKLLNKMKEFLNKKTEFNAESP